MHATSFISPPSPPPLSTTSPHNIRSCSPIFNPQRLPCPPSRVSTFPLYTLIPRGCNRSFPIFCPSSTSLPNTGFSPSPPTCNSGFPYKRLFDASSPSFVSFDALTTIVPPTLFVHSFPSHSLIPQFGCSLLSPVPLSVLFLSQSLRTLVAFPLALFF